MLRSLFRQKDPVQDLQGPIEAAIAKKLILDGRAPDNLQVKGTLDLSKTTQPLHLPQGLHVDSLDLSDCTALDRLPTGLRLKCLKLNGCSALRELPDGLHCDILEARGSRLRRLPDDLRVTYRLDLSDSTELETLPSGLAVGTLIMRNCSALEILPEDLNVFFLDVSGCTALATWPKKATIRFGHLRAQGCNELRELPSWLDNVSQLDIRDCSGIQQVPDTLNINAWLDLANTGIRRLPHTLQDLPLRWRGVPIDARIAFEPDTITAQEVLEQPNVELRRVLLERMGYATFLSQADARVIDSDEDPGGERRLLKLDQLEDEALVCLAVYCPSTARQYIIRVPPAMRTCRQAAAWIAGFDNADDYRPIAET